MKTLSHLKNLLTAELGNEFKNQIDIIVDRTADYIEEWCDVETSEPEMYNTLLFRDENKTLFLGRNTPNGLLTTFAHRYPIKEYRPLYIKRHSHETDNNARRERDA